MFVYNDGSNVVDAVDHLTSLTLGSALPVASGGTGATTSGGAAFALKGANSDITSLAGLTTALTVAQGGTGAATHTANAVLIGEGTSAISTVSPGASGNVLSSDGTNWTSAAAAAFDSGTKMVFQQTAAPSGWTKDTTHNNKAFRVVSGTAGTGGTVAFTTAFTSQTVSISGTTGSTSAGGSVGNHTLATNRIPSHTHPSGGKPATSRFTTNPKGGIGVGPPGVANTGSTGGGAAHNHPFSGSSHNHSFSDTDSVNLAVQYVDLIIAAKD